MYEHYLLTPRLIFTNIVCILSRLSPRSSFLGFYRLKDPKRFFNILPSIQNIIQ